VRDTSSLVTDCLSNSPSLVANSQPAEPLHRYEQRANARLEQLTLEEKIDLLGGVDDVYTLRGQEDWPTLPEDGRRARLESQAANRRLRSEESLADSDLVHRLGVVIGQDVRARGVHFTLGPRINIYRTTLCGH